MFKLLFALNLLFSIQAHGQKLFAFGQIPDSPRLDTKFLAPNETTPELAIPVFAAASRGLYIAVGSERGFIGAANTPGATGLLLVDRNPKIALFNLINTLLITISRDRSHYLQLRLKPSEESWILAARAAGVSELWQNLLKRQVEEWKDRVIENSRFATFHGMERDRQFEGVNYLWEDTLFARLHDMAMRRQITVGVADLNTSDGRTKLKLWLNLTGQVIGIFDYSNAWEDHFTSERSFISLLRTLEPRSRPESLILLTSPDPIYSGSWMYRAYSFAYVKSFNELRDFYHDLSNDWSSYSKTILRLEPKVESDECASRLVWR